MAIGLRYTTLSLRLLFLLVLISIMVSRTLEDAAKDREECTQQLVGLTTCLPYVGGGAKAPTPDCCTGLKQVLKSNKKCLCVIIRDRNDPNLGLQINVTLALGLPSVCHAPANVSQCPALLHLDPNSPEAQVFYQLTGSQSPAPSPTAGGSSTVATGVPEKSDGCCWRGKRWLGVEIVAGGVLIWCFITTHLFM